MDIVKHIKRHTENLQKGFDKLSIDQIKQLKLMALGFYFKFEISERFFRAILEKTIIQNNFSDVDIVVHFQDLVFEKLKRGLNAFRLQVKIKNYIQDIVTVCIK